MALARKGSRRIEIEGVEYRWTVAPDDGYMVLVVEQSRDPGRRLEVFFRYEDILAPDGSGASRINGQRRSITPRVVRNAIRFAFEAGWRPEQKGEALRIADPDPLPAV